MNSLYSHELNKSRGESVEGYKSNNPERDNLELEMNKSTGLTDKLDKDLNINSSNSSLLEEEDGRYFIILRVTCKIFWPWLVCDTAALFLLLN